MFSHNKIYSCYTMMILYVYKKYGDLSSTTSSPKNLQDSLEESEKSMLHAR